MIKIPGTGGGDGALSGGGDGDAGELMGRIRRATANNKHATQVRRRQKSDDRIFVFYFFWGGGGRRRFLRRLHFERQKFSYPPPPPPPFFSFFFALFLFFCLPTNFVGDFSTSWCRWWYGTHKESRKPTQRGAINRSSRTMTTTGVCHVLRHPSSGARWDRLGRSW